MIATALHLVIKLVFNPTLWIGTIAMFALWWIFGMIFAAIIYKSAAPDSAFKASRIAIALSSLICALTAIILGLFEPVLTIMPWLWVFLFGLLTLAFFITSLTRRTS